MNLESASSLPVVPGSVDGPGGLPRFGTYQGELSEVNLAKLGGEYRLALPDRIARHKRWQYALVATHEVIAVFAVVDLGYTANAFACAVDLSDKRVLFDDSFLNLPQLASVNDRPGQGLQVRFRSPGVRFSCERAAGEEQYEMDLDVSWLRSPRTGRFSWKGNVLAAGGPPALTVISPIEGDGRVNVTQKWSGLLAFGALQAGGRKYVLDGGIAGLDYTQGYLARHTAWRWAMAAGRLSDGTPVGLNLSDGLNQSDGVTENALWLGQTLIPLPRARFEFNRGDVLDPWRITTEDGAVDLTFRPLHAHRETRDYRLVRSNFVQPIGFFEGALKANGHTHQVRRLAGVTEDQDVLW